MKTHLHSGNYKYTRGIFLNLFLTIHELFLLNRYLEDKSRHNIKHICMQHIEKIKN